MNDELLLKKTSLLILLVLQIQQDSPRFWIG